MTKVSDQTAKRMSMHVFEIDHYYTASTKGVWPYPHTREYVVQIVSRTPDTVSFRYVDHFNGNGRNVIDALTEADGPGPTDWVFRDVVRSASIVSLRGQEVFVDRGEEEVLRFAASRSEELAFDMADLVAYASVA